MQIEPNDLEEFKRLYKTEFGRDLIQVEASEIAGNLVALYELLCESLPSEREEATRQAATKEPPAAPSQ